MTQSAPLAASPDFDEIFCAKLKDLFAWRRDVRRFRSQIVPAALLADLMAHVDLAPSVGDSRPWRWVSVEGDAQRAAIRANFEAANAAAQAGYHDEQARLYASLKLAGLEQAPAQYAVFCDETPVRGQGLGRQTMPETLGYSVVVAITLFWLAARAKGLGVGWVSILDPVKVARTLDAPNHWRLVAYLCVGWPEEEHLDPELVRHGWVGPR